MDGAYEDPEPFQILRIFFFDMTLNKLDAIVPETISINFCSLLHGNPLSFLALGMSLLLIYTFVIS